MVKIRKKMRNNHKNKILIKLFVIRRDKKQLMTIKQVLQYLRLNKYNPYKLFCYTQRILKFPPPKKTGQSVKVILRLK